MHDIANNLTQLSIMFEEATMLNGERFVQCYKTIVGTSEKIDHQYNEAIVIMQNSLGIKQKDMEKDY